MTPEGLASTDGDGAPEPASGGPEAPQTIEEALRLALAEAPRGRVVIPAELEGFPGTAHGGGVAALFYRATTPRPPVQLRMQLHRGVPTRTALRLVTGSRGATATLALLQDDRPLAEATLARQGIPAADPQPVLEAWRSQRRPEGEVPGTATCLACGSANPVGLGVRFLYDRRFLWREYAPRESYRAADGSLHPALAAVVLDELGWWLGALARGECGVTTELTLTVFRRLPFEPLLVLADRAAVRDDAEDPRGRYCRVGGFLLSQAGALLAAGEVRFAASRAYTRRLLEPFLATTPPETLFRFFPSARGLTGRADER